MRCLRGLAGIELDPGHRAQLVVAERIGTDRLDERVEREQRELPADEEFVASDEGLWMGSEGE